MFHHVSFIFLGSWSVRKLETEMIMTPREGFRTAVSLRPLSEQRRGLYDHLAAVQDPCGRVRRWMPSSRSHLDLAWTSEALLRCLVKAFKRDFDVNSEGKSK